MGLRVQDIHQPSVKSSTTASSSSSSKDVKQLIELRHHMVDELDALSDILTSHNADMDTPLVTNDGFPREDIDVATVRATRVRILRLRNDLIALTSEIEHGLHEYFAGNNAGSATNGGGDSSSSVARPSSFNGASVSHGDILSGNGVSSNVNDIAFCYVNQVSSMSPAEDAGLQCGDKIVSFGYVNASNHSNLTRLATIVSGNIGVR